MIAHDCTRLVEVISFVEEESSTAKSGWFLDYLYRDKRTEAEKLEFRDYSKESTKPLFYTGACVPPNLIKQGAEKLDVLEFSFPVIKAETKITGCDVDEQRILKDGTIVPVGKQRFDNSFKRAMKEMFDARRATHILEAITLLKTGGYVLKDTETSDIGVLDFGRATELTSVDLTGVTGSDWSGICAKPMKTIQSILREMSKYKAVAGKIDIIYSPLAWEAMEAHAEREAIKFNTTPSDLFTQSMIGYADVEYMGTSGGKYNHWVSSADMVDYDGTEKPVLQPGEIMIVSRAGFDGQRVFRTITSDNKEKLPQGANVFVYDDLEKEYEAKCRSFGPWIEEYHLMVPGNVNGAVVVKVVPDDFESCVACEECPPVGP